jgi:hypothetical protein
MDELTSIMSNLDINKDNCKNKDKKDKKIKNKKIKLVCKTCNKIIIDKLCYCYNLEYYNKNIKNIIKIQKFWRERQLSKINFNNKLTKKQNVVNDNIESIIKIQKFWRERQLLKLIFNKKLTKKQNLVNEIFKPDKYGISEWKTRNELSNTKLKLTKNGNCRHGKFFNDSRFIWEKKIEKRTLVALRTNGFDLYNNDNINKRAIRKDIKEFHYKVGCVCCGSKSDLVIDHKNDLYNDPNVLNISTQKLSDFQCLCNHCNLQKRQVCIYTKKNKKRYGATNIPQLKIFNIDFIIGDETFNINDKDALKGTYWYDPIAFMEHIKKTISL